MDSPYSNREIDSHFKDIKESLSRIEEQTVKTNGRVSKLEQWKGYLTGAIAIIAFIVIPLIVYSFNQSTGKEKIEAAVREITQK